jgi:hypothetical protein
MIHFLPIVYSIMYETHPFKFNAIILHLNSFTFYEFYLQIISYTKAIKNWYRKYVNLKLKRT